MRILFRLSYPELRHAQLADVFAESVVKALGFKCYLNVRHGSVILCHGDKIGLKKVSFKAAELRVYYGSCYLSCSVGAEVEENNGVVFPKLAHGRAVLCDNRGNHKFVGDAVVIALLDCGDRAVIGLADALDDRIVRL